MFTIDSTRSSAFLLTLAAFVYLQVLTIPIHEKFGLLVFLTCSILILIFNKKRFLLAAKKTLFISYLIGTGYLIAALGSQTTGAIDYFKSFAYTYLVYLAFASTTYESKFLAIDMLSKVAYFAVTCMFLSYIYALNNGTPFFVIKNPNGILNYFYIGSFSRENHDGVTRASWLFDEPGTASYFLTFIAIARIGLKRGNKGTLFIMLLGLTSYSTAHLVSVILIGLHLIFKYGFLNMRKFFIILIAVASGLFFFDFQEQVIDSQFTERIDKDKGYVKGNNRYGQVVEYINKVDVAGVIFGYPECRLTGNSWTRCGKFTDQSSHIFTPIFSNGLIASMPFYILILILFKSFFLHVKDSSSILYFLIIITQFQRPYFYDNPYFLVSILATMTLINQDYLYMRIFKFSTNSLRLNFIKGDGKAV